MGLSRFAEPARVRRIVLYTAEDTFGNFFSIERKGGALSKGLSSKKV
jgi:hypothetical protein